MGYYHHSDHEVFLTRGDAIEYVGHLDTFEDYAGEDPSDGKGIPCVLLSLKENSIDETILWIKAGAYEERILADSTTTGDYSLCSEEGLQILHEHFSSLAREQKHVEKLLEYEGYSDIEVLYDEDYEGIFIFYRDAELNRYCGELGKPYDEISFYWNEETPAFYYRMGGRDLLTEEELKELKKFPSEWAEETEEALF